MNKKFKKFYDEMRKKEEDIKKRLNIYAELVEKYKMKECKFQPNINENEDKKKKKKGLIQVILQKGYIMKEFKTEVKKQNF